MIKAVIFDCFGVLILPARLLLYQAHPELSTQIRELEHNSDRGLLDRSEFLQAVGSLVDMSPDEVERRYYDVNARSKDALEWVEQVKATGKYKVGLLSNIGQDWLDDFLSSVNRTNLFDQVVLSYKVGLVKPDPRIFELMAEKLSLSTNECVMIDDIAENIDGAKQAGMQGIVFESIEQARAELNLILEA